MRLLPAVVVLALGASACSSGAGNVADAGVVDAASEVALPPPDAGTDVATQHPDGATGGSIKWSPGYYMLSDSQYQPGRPLSRWQPELNDAVAAKPTLQGFAFFTTWAGLEWKTEGNWQFGGGASSTFVIDQIVSFCRAHGLKVALVINPDVFNSGTPSAPSLSGDDGDLPYYLLTDPKTYGAGLYGSSGVTPTGASASGSSKREASARTSRTRTCRRSSSRCSSTSAPCTTRTPWSRPSSSTRWTACIHTLAPGRRASRTTRPSRTS